MPVYEYQCRACSRDFEYQQRMTDPEKTTCEVCGGALERLISRTAFALKGSGWYKDLYASPKPEKADGKADTAAKSDAKADAPAANADKPAAKPDAGSGGTTPSGSTSSSSSGGSGSSSAAAAKAP